MESLYLCQFLDQHNWGIRKVKRPLGLEKQLNKFNSSSSTASNNYQFFDEYLWANEILKFFEIQQLYDQEKQAALKIEGFLVRCKKVLVKQKFKKIISKLRG